jgi:uncharacterized protein
LTISTGTTHDSEAPVTEHAMVEERVRISSGGGELDAILATPSKQDTDRFALLLHGAPGGAKDGPAGLFTELARHLAASGIGSLRYDARGSGQATGVFRDATLTSMVTDFQAARSWLRARHHPERLAVVGESLGATVALLGRDDAERAIALLYPAIWLTEQVIEDWITPQAIAEAEANGFIIREDSEVGLSMLGEIQQRPDVAQELAGLTTPTIIIAGDADLEVPAWQAERAAELVAGPVRNVVVPGGGHGLERPSDQAIVCGQVCDWFRTYL